MSPAEPNIKPDFSAATAHSSSDTPPVAPGPGTEPPRKRRRRVDPESIPLRKLIPNLMTAGALCAGLAALQFALDGQFTKAVGCVAAAFVLDGLDGRTARFLKVTSRFGEKFDSIADFTAFGVAPAFIIYQWQLRQTMGTWGLAIAALYALCAAFRLARFTYQARKQKLGAPVSKFFQGLPAPAGGCSLMIPVMLELSDTVHYRFSFVITAVWTVLLALLMISKVPMISIKGARISRRLAKPLIVVAGAIMLGLIYDTWLTLSLLTAVYLGTFPLGLVLHRRQLRSAKDPGGVGAPKPTAPAGPGR